MYVIMSDISPLHYFDFEDNAPQNEEVPPSNSPQEEPPQASLHENLDNPPPPSLDLESMLDDEEDLGYVDTYDLFNCKIVLTI